MFKVNVALQRIGWSNGSKRQLVRPKGSVSRTRGGAI